MASRKLTVEIIGDSSSLERALKKASSSSSGFSSGMKKAGKIAGAAMLGLGAIAAGAFAVTLKRGFAELSDGQKVAAQTAAGLKSTGNAANVTVKGVNDLANSLSRMSGVDDEVIQQGENLLLTFTKVRNETGKGNDVFDRATQAALDLSVKGFGSMDATSKMLGKALQDPVKGITAMSRAGVTFTEQQKKTIKSLVDSGQQLEAQKMILKEVETQVGGSAKAYGETLPGQLNRAKNAFDDMASNVAAKFLPVLTGALDWVNRNWSTISAVVEAVSTKIEAAVTRAADAVRANFTAIKAIATSAFDGARIAGEKFVSFIQTDVGQQLAISAVAFFGISRAIAAIAPAVRLANSALLLLKANPLWLAAAGLALGISYVVQQFIEGKIQAARLSDELRIAAGSADRLRSSLDALKSADLSVKEAHLRHEESLRKLNRALADYNTAVRKSGENSQAAKDALLTLKDANLQVERTDLDITEAIKNQTKAHRDRNVELGKAAQKVLDLAKGTETANNTFAKGAAADKFAESMQKVAVGAGATALKLKDIDPAGSRAAAKASLLAGIAEDLTKKLGRVPSKKEIVAEAKAVNFQAFYQSLLNAQTKVSNAKKGMETAGANMGQGVADGLWSKLGTIVQTAARLALAARQAAGDAAGEGSPAKEWIKLGQAMGDGVRIGWLLGTIDLPEKMSDTLRKAVEKAQQAIQSQQGKMSSAWQRLADDSLRAFDAATDRGLAKIQGKLAARLSAIDAQLAKSLAKIENSRSAETPKEKELRELQEAKAQQERTQAISEAQSQLSSAQASGDPDAILAAQKALDDALYQQKVADLEKQAELERATADKKAATAAAAAEKLADKQRKAADKNFADRQRDYQSERDLLRRHLEDWLAIQGQLLEEHPKQWAKIHAKLMKKFRDVFGPDFKKAGQALGEGFAKGLNESVSAMESAAEQLARMIASYLKSMSPTETGPLSDLDKWGPNFVKTYADGITKNMGYLDRAMSRVTTASAGGFDGRGGMGRTAGTPPGNVVVNVHVAGNVTSEGRLAEVIANRFEQMQRRGRPMPWGS